MVAARNVRASRRGTARAALAAASVARRAFTLLELLCALVLITLIAAFSLRAYFGRSDVTLERAVDLLVTDVRMARTRATFFTAPVEVVFAADGKGYAVVGAGAIVASTALGPPIPVRRFGEGAVFENVRFGRIDLAGGDRLAFDAGGNLTGGGTVVLCDADESRTVEFETTSGRIRVRERSEVWDATLR